MLVIWPHLHESGSNLAVSLRAGPELLGTVAWGTRFGLEPGRVCRFRAIFAVGLFLKVARSALETLGAAREDTRLCE